MSNLQYQLKELLPKLSTEARKLQDPEAKKRYYLLRAVAFSARDVKKCCEARGESSRLFYKWADRLLETESLESLRTLSKKPICSPNKIDAKVEKRICRIRRKYPFMGSVQIRFELSKKMSKKLPNASTVYQVLKRNGFIKKEYSKRLTKKHMKRYRRPFVGYLQMDFKYVPYAIGGEQCYQLSCVDHHSSWRLIRCYEYKNIESVKNFLNELKATCPFKILQIQTDNDKAFTDKYRIETNGYPTGDHELDVWCAQNDVEHKLIPIGQKELNGKVENTHKWDDREFFSQIQPRSLSELQQKALVHNQRWNNDRATQALGWKTPVQAVHKSLSFITFWKLWMHDQAVQNDLTVTRIDKLGNTYVPVPKLMPYKTGKTITKKIDPVDRYLKYMAWERQQNRFVSPISPIFSNNNFNGPGPRNFWRGMGIAIFAEIDLKPLKSCQLTVELLPLFRST